MLCLLSLLLLLLLLLFTLLITCYIIRGRPAGARRAHAGESRAPGPRARGQRRRAIPRGGPHPEADAGGLLHLQRRRQRHPGEEGFRQPHRGRGRAIYCYIQ